MKQTFFVAALVILSWGNLHIILRSTGLPLPLFHPWIIWLVYLGGPPVSAGLAMIAWHRARAWRRLEEQRSLPDQGPGQQLARGGHSVGFIRRGPDCLERWSLRLVILALLATWLWFPGTHLPLLINWLIW